MEYLRGFLVFELIACVWLYLVCRWFSSPDG